MSKERILNYLAQGVQASQVASIVGCSAGYISQLKKDEAFSKELAERTAIEAPKLTEEVLLTNKYTAIEHKILEQMENAMGMAELPALTQALKAVAERQDRRKQMTLPSSNVNPSVKVVVIQVPQHAVPEYLVNETKEIIQIGQKPMSPMSSEGVKNLFRQMKDINSVEAQPLTEF